MRSKLRQSQMSLDDFSCYESIKSPVKGATRKSSVTSTTNVLKFKSKIDGNKMINQYIIEGTIGKGTFAIVKKCRDSKTEQYFAIK